MQPPGGSLKSLRWEHACYCQGYNRIQCVWDRVGEEEAGEEIWEALEENCKRLIFYLHEARRY